MTSTRCHPLIVAAVALMAITSAAVYATDGVNDGEGVGVIENDIQDEDLEGEVITVNVSTDGQLQWQYSQDHGSPTPINRGPRSRPYHHPRRRRCRGLHGCGRHRGPHGGRMRGSGRIRIGRGRGGRRLHHQQRSCVGCGRWMEAGNMTMEQRLVGQCQRLDARLAGEATAVSNLTRNELVARYIARKMNRFGVTDAELRQTLSALLRRRFRDMSTCCRQVETEPKIACVRQAMLGRFQRICNGDEPICPWMLLRNSTHESRQPADDDDDNDDDTQQQQQQQPNMTATCCPLQDSERLGCFLNEMAAHRQRWRESMAQQALIQSREMRTASAGRARGMRRRRMRRVGGYRN